MAPDFDTPTTAHKTHEAQETHVLPHDDRLRRPGAHPGETSRAGTSPRPADNGRDSSIGNTQAYAVQKPGLFDDLSFAQVIAGAAAAATSVVLASKIGFAGSVIGAAVSSVVTVVSSQIYRHFITASAEKLKSAHTKASDARAGGRETAWPATGADEPIAYAGEASYPGARLAPERLRARAKAERAATQRKVIGFSAVAAVVAVALCAAIILATTAGEGLGTKPAPLFTAPAAPQDEPAADEPSAEEQPTTEPATNESDTTEPPADDAVPGGATDGGAGATTPSEPADGTSGDGSGANGGNHPDRTEPDTPDAGTTPDGTETTGGETTQSAQR